MYPGGHGGQAADLLGVRVVLCRPGQAASAVVVSFLRGFLVGFLIAG